MATEMLHQGDSARCDTMEAMHAATGFEAAIRFIDWADSQRQLTAEKVIARFGLGRATAYRWVRAYRDARGLA